MWQLFSLGAIFCNTLEETIDKAAMLGSSTLDTFVAALIRNIIVLGVAIVVAFLIYRSVPEIIFSLPIIWWGLVYAIQAISYTWILKYIEITAASVTFALLPLVFLPIDIFFRQESLTLMQIGGVGVLVIGGLIFFARKDLSKRLSNSKYILMMLGVLIFDAIVIGSEGYIFKSYYEQYELSPASFLVSGMLYMCAFLAVMLAIHFAWAGKGIQLQGALSYARGASLAKLADYGNIFFTLHALTLATVTQVAAMKVIHPLILLMITMFAQQKFKVDLEEVFTKETVIQKSAGILLVVIGSFLIA
ncbi:MAG: hypothetical protein G01um10148_804 [Parcubacteria group bacterium Gr01-1014_8]|nr:MAG: hypothetical protein G01um10148_804 [Parcubacteria group bacterium Gr01-1014_8]